MNPKQPPRSRAELNNSTTDSASSQVIWKLIPKPKPNNPIRLGANGGKNPNIRDFYLTKNLARLQAGKSLLTARVKPTCSAPSQVPNSAKHRVIYLARHQVGQRAKKEMLQQNNAIHSTKLNLVKASSQQASKIFARVTGQ